MHDSKHDNKLDTLNGYLNRGWALVPLHHVLNGACSCRDGPACKSAGKHPRVLAWQQPAQLVRDASTLAAVHAGHPQGNWGIATGAASGLWVLDYDPAHAGPEALALVELLSAEGRPAHVGTGGGGLHWYFALAAGEGGDVVRNHQGSRRLPSGLDVRGEGGQVVAPPSVSAKGSYRWLGDTRIWPAPDWLVSMVVAPAPVKPRIETGGAPGVLAGATTAGDDISRGGRYARAAVGAALAELTNEPEGNRNNTAYRVACRLVELINAPWSGLDAVVVRADFESAGDLNGRQVAELDGVWNRAQMHVGATAAILPAANTGGDVIPLLEGSQPGRSGTAGGVVEAPDPFEQAVVVELGRLRVRAEARRRLGVESAAAARAAMGGVEAVDWRELMARDHSQVDWLPGKLCERGQQVALVGEGKSGKSLFMLDLAWRAAAGKDFLAYTGCGPLRVLYVDRENAQRDLAQRLAALGAHPEEIGALAYYTFPAMAYLDQDGEDLLALVERHGADIVVIDTVSRFVAGGENDSDTWLSLYRNVHVRLKERGCAGVRLDHFGKDFDRGSRGSSAKSQDIDHVWELATLSQRRDGVRHESKLRLTRTHTRSGVGEGVFDVDRTGVKDERGELWVAGATSHVLAIELAKVWSGEGVREIAARLDEAGIPRHWGRGAVKAEAAKLGIRQSDTMWGHVLRYRKEQHAAQLRGVELDSEQDGFVDPR